MPDLNVGYTKAELQQLREAAAAAGMSVEDYVRTASVRDGQHSVFVTTALNFYDGNVAAFDEAFPDDAPHRSSGAAA
ncbi:plasmid mobilization protein [Streptomyces sp. MI02-7b]|uniref:plasmid mobilization protein n=1 Tax=Streptomyces sp. MI02-7b TaxID=462941 RepID=UPI0029B02EC4|nr:hypothetical protein [Streptomyces sp. MI02-7b]MDX3075877.1 hypothetical protein [Streptomyces sp. MI02-7b]